MDSELSSSHIPFGKVVLIALVLWVILGGAVFALGEILLRNAS